MSKWNEILNFSSNHCKLSENAKDTILTHLFHFQNGSQNAPKIEKCEKTEKIHHFKLFSNRQVNLHTFHKIYINDQYNMKIHSEITF